MKSFNIKLQAQVFIFGALLLALGACGNYNRNESRGGSEGSSGVVDGATTDITFEMMSEKIFKPRCIKCHTQPGRHDGYAIYNLVKADLPKILTRVNSKVDGFRMPGGGLAPLSASEMAMLNEWVAAGAPENGSNGGDSPVDDGGEVKYSFADVKENIFKKNACLKCHSQYNDYATARKEASKILGNVLSNKMPYPKGKNDTPVPVTKKQKEILMAWVAQGAPEFVGLNLPTPDLPLLPNWLSLRNKVLGPKCILCHNSYGKRGPTDMSSYKSLKAWFVKSPLLFDFENVEESHFVGSIIGRVDDDEFFFDPMPLNIPVDDVSDLPAVTPAELDVIREWIRLEIPRK